MPPKISICIPAYKRVQLLRRLLDSICAQSFRDFEVIITDDSPDNEVRNFCIQYRRDFNLNYQKNETALGTPENWNEAVRLATGEWIKIMHDDDWFTNENSLGEFAKAIDANKGVQFFFSKYNNVDEENGETQERVPSASKLERIKRNSAVLLAGNVIGPPSVTIYKNDPISNYDSRLKWLVDVDFYIRYMQDRKIVYINQPLVNIGISKTQVTQYTFRIAKVEIPEHLIVLEKIGERALKNIVVFDAYWRLIRNMGIRDASGIAKNGYDGTVPHKVHSMINFQSKLPPGLLKNGFFSKSMMLISFLLNG